MNRRNFLRNFVGSPLLGAMCSGLVREAYGQPLQRQIFVSLLTGFAFPRRFGGGGPSNKYVPAELNWNGHTSLPSYLSHKNFQWPACFGGLSRYKQRVLILDNLFVAGGKGSVGEWEHEMASGPMCANNLAQRGAPPAGPSIDQHIAQVLSTDTAYSSLTCEVHTWTNLSHADPEKRTKSVAYSFARSREKLLAAECDPRIIWKKYFPNSMMTPNTQPVVPATGLFDSIKNEISFLRPKLAGSERVKFDDYLTSLENYARRQEARSKASCGGAPPANVNINYNERELVAETLIELGFMALECGLTNVASFAFGSGPGHEAMWIPGGHDDSYHGNCAQFWNAYTQRLASGLDRLSAVKQSDGSSLADSTVMMMMADNGGTDGNHHAKKASDIGGCSCFPVVLLGNKKFREGGFMSFPSRGVSAASVYKTVADTLGAPGFTAATENNTRFMPEIMV